MCSVDGAETWEPGRSLERNSERRAAQPPICPLPEPCATNPAPRVSQYGSEKHRLDHDWEVCNEAYRH